MTIPKEKTPLVRGLNYRVRLGKKTHRYNWLDYPLYGFLKARLSAEARTPKEHKTTVGLAVLKVRTRAVILISRIMTVVHPDSVLLAVLPYLLLWWCA